MFRQASTHPGSDQELLAECCDRARVLLRRNLSPGGILAATPGSAASARGYAAVFGRDAAICALGMAVSDDAQLQREAATGLLTLARYQARNGQLPKFVDPREDEADFWYLGCIDATLWWLIAIAWLDGRDPTRGLAGELAPRIERAIALAVVPGAPALLPAAAERGERLGRHHAALRLRALHERAVAPREAPVSPSRCGRDQAQLQRAVPPVRADDRGLPSRAAAHALRAPQHAQSRPLPELRQLLLLRRRGRRVRQRARDPRRPRRRDRHAPDPARDRSARGPTIPTRCAWCAIRSWSRASSGARTCRAIARTSRGSTTTAASGLSSEPSGSIALGEAGLHAQARADLVRDRARECGRRTGPSPNGCTAAPCGRPACAASRGTRRRSCLLANASARAPRCSGPRASRCRPPRTPRKTGRPRGRFRPALPSSVLRCLARWT